MKTFILFLSSVFFYISINEIKAQGGWISQDLQPTMKGAHLSKTGPECIIYTKAISRYIYVFDLKLKGWIEIDLGSEQNIRAVEAGKKVVFAYSDTLLVAYSAVTSTYGTTGYSGNIISPQATKTSSRGYGCGDDAAYVWTDQNIFYVFDGLAGQWNQFEYGATQNASGAANFWSGNNYAAGIFHRAYPEKNRNVVYSLVTGTFNITETGGVYYPSYGGVSMTGGFVSTFSASPDAVLFAGYSAFTNEFYIIEENTPYLHLSMGSLDENWVNLPKRNVYGYNVMRGDEVSKEVKINTFDTEKAAWFTHTFSFGANEMESLSNYRAGGSTTICSMSDQSGSVTFYIFSSETGAYRIVEPGIYYNARTYYYNAGNNFTSALDYWNNVWVGNAKTGFSQTLNFNESEFTNIAFSSDYLSFCQYEDTSSGMDIWFFNSMKDKSSKIRVTKDVYPHFSFNPNSYIFVLRSPENLAVFYSALNDTICSVKTSLAGDIVTYGTEGIFSWIKNSTSCLVFDAANLNTFTINSLPVSRGISDSLILFMYGNIYDVYDASKGKLADPFNLGSPPGYNYNGGNILLIANNNYSKYYAFQKTGAGWTELIPEGNYVSASVGKNVALIARSTKLYAFAAEEFTRTAGNYLPPVTFSLYQNYPNPFNYATKIRWETPISGKQTLKLYDILGNEVATLFDGYKSAGIHEVEFKGLSGAGVYLASGVYLYRLRTGNYFLSKKMILMK